MNVRAAARWPVGEGGGRSGRDAIGEVARRTSGARRGRSRAGRVVKLRGIARTPPRRSTKRDGRVTPAPAAPPAAAQLDPARVLEGALRRGHELVTDGRVRSRGKL